MTTTTFKILGETDEVAVCDCCGRSGLPRTVGLEDGAGAVLYYGTTCAARATGIKSDVLVLKAKSRNRALPIIEAIRAALPNGLEAAKAAGAEIAKTTRINGGTVSVSGFASWGQINVDWSGGREVIRIAA